MKKKLSSTIPKDRNLFKMHETKKCVFKARMFLEKRYKRVFSLNDITKEKSANNEQRICNDS